METMPSHDAVGGLSGGVLSFGAVSAGLVAIGGIAAGVWPVFGGLLLGWQSFGGCFTLGWNAAVGNCALAHDYALGQFAIAAQANNPAAQAMLENNFNFQSWEFRGHRLCARQAFQGSLKGQTDTAAAPSTGLRMALQDGTVTGTSWFDVELGLVIEANLTQDLTMDIITPAPARGGAGGLTLTDRMHQTIAIKLESVN